MPEVRIFWKSKTTGASGHGQPVDSVIATLWRAEAQARHPDLVHWLEAWPEGALPGERS